MSLSLMGLEHPENDRLTKILVAASHGAIEVSVDKSFKVMVDNEKEDYMNNCHPLGRMPALRTQEGYIFESNSILRYVGRLDKTGTLYGRTPFEASEIDMWLDYTLTEMEPAMKPFMNALYTLTPLTPEATAEAMPKVHEALGGIEKWLETRTFIVGERITIADIAIAYTLSSFFRNTAGEAEGLSKKYIRCWRLYITVMRHPKTATVLAATGATFGLRN